MEEAAVAANSLRPCPRIPRDRPMTPVELVDFQNWLDEVYRLVNTLASKVS